MGWFVLGFVLGFVVMCNRKGNSTTNDSEKTKATFDRYDEDIAYYKKLTRDLVEENKQLRKQINAS